MITKKQFRSILYQVADVRIDTRYIDNVQFWGCDYVEIRLIIGEIVEARAFRRIIDACGAPFSEAKGSKRAFVVLACHRTVGKETLQVKAEATEAKFKRWLAEWRA